MCYRWGRQLPSCANISSTMLCSASRSSLNPLITSCSEYYHLYPTRSGLKPREASRPVAVAQSWFQSQPCPTQNLCFQPLLFIFWEPHFACSSVSSTRWTVNSRDQCWAPRAPCDQCVTANCQGQLVGVVCGLIPAPTRVCPPWHTLTWGLCTGSSLREIVACAFYFQALQKKKKLIAALFKIWPVVLQFQVCGFVSFIESQTCAAITTVNFRTFSSPPKVSHLPASLHLFPGSLGSINHLSVFYTHTDLSISSIVKIES